MSESALKQSNKSFLNSLGLDEMHVSEMLKERIYERIVDHHSGYVSEYDSLPNKGNQEFQFIDSCMVT